MTTSATLPAPFILPLASDQATLPLVGGKGANLGRLARAGFPVPAGFLISTGAYRAFIVANGLEDAIKGALPENATAAEQPAAERPAAGAAGTYEEASARIRRLFSQGSIPQELAAEISSAYTRLGRSPVAVRSSATAEDLPEMSFAGQQDTYLNVTGEECLLRTVVDCWSSLWTARAISYRARNGVPQAGVSLAVVVQKMVESEASGVLFTADPLTGLRTVTVIDATLGLGEALVSGQVEPDHYVVDTAAGKIELKTLGAKAIAVRGRAGGGTTVVEENAGARQALPDAQIQELAGLGQRVAAIYGGTPQDIEWAWADGRLHLLQARPITSLYPTPDGLPAEPLKVMLSLAAVQGMLDPITPLGRDLFRHLMVGGAHLFGLRVTAATQTAVYTAGERLWINFTPLLRSALGRKVLPTAMEFIDPAAGQAVRSLWDDPRLQPGRKGMSLQARARLVRFFLPVAGNVLLNLLSPDARRRRIVDHGERVLAEVRALLAALDGLSPRARLAELARLAPKTVERYLSPAVRLFVSGIASGMASFNLVSVLSESAAKTPDDGLSGSGAGGWSDRVLAITRGMPNNPTTEMDLALWEVAGAIRRDPASLDAFTRLAASELAERYRAGTLPGSGQPALARFMARYGERGLAEIDLGRPRWLEEPEHVLEVLTGYLKIEDADQAPDAVFARGAAAARVAIEGLAAGVARGRRGWIKTRLLRLAAGRARALMGMRESPKFFMVRLFGIFRGELLKAGQELAGAGELKRADDLFYLSFAELAAFAGRGPGDWTGLIAARREAYQRELRRRQIPRVLLSDGRAFYEGIGEAAGLAGALQGSPVSPGVAEGRVRVVLDPRRAGLLPGEVLVCPGTDPSWTPLFLTASALVMEVGGMMTHGAVVAREYGIPAVVGVHEATTRLQTGQRVRVNGSDGTVNVLNETGGDGDRLAGRDQPEREG